MQYLRYLGFFLIFLVLGFLAMGVFNSRFSTDLETTVQASPVKVREALLDTSDASRWMNNYLQTDFVQGKRSTVGDVSMISFKDEQGRIMTVKERITGMSDEVLQMEWEHERFVLQFEYLSTATDSGTQLKLRFSGQGKGLLYRSMFAFIKSSLIAGQEANLNNLKAFLENE